ncbi:MAG: hypothetical protein ABSH36_04340 [Solirubrobacteraceae bacterium]
MKADIAAEADVRDAAGAGLRQEPGWRHVQQGRSLAGIEQRRDGLLADQCGELRRESAGVGALGSDTYSIPKISQTSLI